MQSDSTNDPDNGAKLEEYTNIPSLQRYAIVSQTVRQVVLYRREGEKWVLEVLSDHGEVDVPCLEAGITLDQIYAGLEFASLSHES